MHGNMIDITGHRFGRLIAICRTFRKGDSQKPSTGEYYWLCKCDCGNTKEVMMSSLRNGKTTSCGCYGKEQRLKATKLEFGEASFNKLFCGYKLSARSRNYKFSLSKQEFKTLVESDCHYCNSRPTQIISAGTRYGSYTYNGIDRIDNSVGYELKNCVPCCKKCNYMKRELTYEEFILHIKNIYNTRCIQ